MSSLAVWRVARMNWSMYHDSLVKRDERSSPILQTRSACWRHWLHARPESQQGRAFRSRRPAALRLPASSMPHASSGRRCRGKIVCHRPTPAIESHGCLRFSFNDLKSGRKPQTFKKDMPLLGSPKKRGG